MHRSVTQDEVGKSALYLLSDMASGVTGEVHFVDTGYNIVGPVDARQRRPPWQLILSWNVNGLRAVLAKGALSPLAGTARHPLPPGGPRPRGPGRAGSCRACPTSIFAPTREAGLLGNGGALPRQARLVAARASDDQGFRRRGQGGHGGVSLTLRRERLRAQQPARPAAARLPPAMGPQVSARTSAALAREETGASSAAT